MWSFFCFQRHNVLKLSYISNTWNSCKVSFIKIKFPAAAATEAQNIVRKFQLMQMGYSIKDMFL